MGLLLEIAGGKGWEPPPGLGEEAVARELGRRKPAPTGGDAVAMPTVRGIGDRASVDLTSSPPPPEMSSPGRLVVTVGLLAGGAAKCWLPRGEEEVVEGEERLAEARLTRGNGCSPAPVLRGLYWPYEEEEVGRLSREVGVEAEGSR